MIRSKYCACVFKIFFFFILFRFIDSYLSGMLIGRSGSDASLRMDPSNKVQAISMSRTNSSPGNFESSIDRPMRLAEIFVASEHALHHTISNPNLWKALSSVEEFEVLKSYCTDHAVSS